MNGISNNEQKCKQGGDLQKNCWVGSINRYPIRII